MVQRRSPRNRIHKVNARLPQSDLDVMASWNHLCFPLTEHFNLANRVHAVSNKGGDMDERSFYFSRFQYFKDFFFMKSTCGRAK